ncbi:MAG: hypothetical protein A4E58_02531 [Syntrophorhabdus sp. PtaB.Bin006]|nr:MAG: hypothetical protein A4E58_02531 [Syntrophorhabdus sp. PtaB.Bin006]
MCTWAVDGHNNRSSGSWKETRKTVDFPADSEREGREESYCLEKNEKKSVAWQVCLCYINPLWAVSSVR